jgi:hypothetical protein
MKFRVLPLRQPGQFKWDSIVTVEYKEPGYRLATSWTTEGLEFESRPGQEFSLYHVVQTGSGAHPPTSRMGIEGGGALSLRVKRP